MNTQPFRIRKRKRAAKAAPDAACPTCKRPITSPDVLRTAKASAESVVALEQQVLRLTLIVAGVMKLHRGRVIIPMTDAAELGELRHTQNHADGTVLLEAPALQSPIILLNT